LPKTSNTRGIKVSEDTTGKIKLTSRIKRGPTMPGKTRKTSRIRGSAATGTKSITAGNGEAFKATNGIKGNAGTGTRNTRVGNLEAMAWFVIPRVAIASGAAISHRTVKVW
jgi:hypothetical protein